MTLLLWRRRGENLYFLAPRRETLNLPIPAAARSLIDRAALSSGKTRTDFILEAARRAAEETLLDRAMIATSRFAFGSDNLDDNRG
jgi:uncharacterized protein (DUF1778 family)